MQYLKTVFSCCWSKGTRSVSDKLGLICQQAVHVNLVSFVLIPSLLQIVLIATFLSTFALVASSAKSRDPQDHTRCDLPFNWSPIAILDETNLITYLPLVKNKYRGLVKIRVNVCHISSTIMSAL